MIMPTGSNRASGFTGTDFGMSGGASTAISPSAIGGVGNRGSRVNSIRHWTPARPASFHPQLAKIAADA
jgi:hypothetical protein